MYLASHEPFEEDLWNEASQSSQFFFEEMPSPLALITQRIVFISTESKGSETLTNLFRSLLLHHYAIILSGSILSPFTPKQAFEVLHDYYRPI